MKRWMSVVIGAVMILGTAGACDPPPPDGWVRPQVSDLAVTPAPVVPGEPFTVSATLTDDHHVAGVEMWLNSPNGEQYLHLCTLPGFDPVGAPQTAVDVDISCELPDFAVNGTWQVVLNVYDGETFTGHGAGAGQASTTFEAVGGTNDVTPPAVDSLVISPASPVQGQPFTVTVRVSDDHLRIPSGYVVMSYSNTFLRSWDCTAQPTTQLSPVQQEFVFACPGRPELPAGPYELRFAMSDLNRNQLEHTVDLVIVDAASSTP